MFMTLALTFLLPVHLPSTIIWGLLLKKRWRRLDVGFEGPNNPKCWWNAPRPCIQLFKNTFMSVKGVVGTYVNQTTGKVKVNAILNINSDHSYSTPQTTLTTLKADQSNLNTIRLNIVV